MPGITILRPNEPEDDANPERVAVDRAGASRGCCAFNAREGPLPRYLMGLQENISTNNRSRETETVRRRYLTQIKNLEL